MISNKVIFDAILILLFAKIINKNETDKKNKGKYQNNIILFCFFFGISLNLHYLCRLKRK